MRALLLPILDPQPLKIHIACIEDCTRVSFIRASVSSERIQLFRLKLSFFGEKLCGEGAEKRGLSDAWTGEVEGYFLPNLVAGVVDGNGVGVKTRDSDVGDVERGSAGGVDEGRRGCRCRGRAVRRVTTAGSYTRDSIGASTFSRMCC